MPLQIDRNKDFKLPRVEVRLVDYGSLSSEEAIRSPEDDCILSYLHGKFFTTDLKTAKEFAYSLLIVNQN